MSIETYEFGRKPSDANGICYRRENVYPEGSERLVAFWQAREDGAETETIAQVFFHPDRRVTRRIYLDDSRVSEEVFEAITTLYAWEQAVKAEASES